MGFIQVGSPSSHGGILRVTVAPELWFWLAITLPLMMVTLASWWTWEWRSGRRTSVNEGLV
jgi:hypothetical protein